MKKITPYQRLLDNIIEFCGKLKYRHRVTMWTYHKNRLHEGWALAELYHRTAAAEQLGYEVVLIARDEGLVVQYVKKPPSIPPDWEE